MINDAVVGRRTILELAREYVWSSHAWERALQAGPFTRPLTWLGRRWRVEHLDQQCTELLNDLLQEYLTAMRQVLVRVAHPTTLWPDVFDLLVEDVESRVLRMRDYRSMAVGIWHALGDAIGFHPLPSDLEVRFMLRQLVDDIAHRESRKLLIDLVYNLDERDVDDALLAELDEAYVHLHDVVVSYERDVALLTNGLLDASWVREVSSNRPDSLQIYDALLFGGAESHQ